MEEEKTFLTQEESEAFHHVNSTDATDFDDKTKELAQQASKKIEAFIQMYIDEANMVKSISEGAAMKTLEGDELKEFEDNLEGLKQVMKSRDELIDDMIKSDDFHKDFKRFIIKNRIECHDSLNRLVSLAERWHARDEAIKEIEANDEKKE